MSLQSESAKTMCTQKALQPRQVYTYRYCELGVVSCLHDVRTGGFAILTVQVPFQDTHRNHIFGDDNSFQDPPQNFRLWWRSFCHGMDVHNEEYCLLCQVYL